MKIESNSQNQLNRVLTNISELTDALSPSQLEAVDDHMWKRAFAEQLNRPAATLPDLPTTRVLDHSPSQRAKPWRAMALALDEAKSRHAHNPVKWWVDENKAHKMTRDYMVEYFPESAKAIYHFNSSTSLSLYSPGARNGLKQVSYVASSVGALCLLGVLSCSAVGWHNGTAISSLLLAGVCLGLGNLALGAVKGLSTAASDDSRRREEFHASLSPTLRSAETRPRL